ncbi:MAG: cupin domain-containing protein [Actinomycetota bacterium]
MAFSGQVLDNPISGERITFRKTAADTDGDLLAIDLELSPEGRVPGSHVHPHQEERFEVLSGVVKFRRGLKTVFGHPGDIVVVPPGAIHRFTNGGSEAARLRVEVRPALRMEELFETAVALAKEGRTNKRGMPHPLDLALFMRRFDAEVRAPLAPAGAVRALMAPLWRLARHRGLDARYRKPIARPPRSRRDARRPRSRSLRRA